MASENQDNPTSQPQPETTRDREVIVTNGGSGPNYAGVVVAILAIIVFGILGYLFIGAVGEGGTDGSPMPDEVNVDVEPDAGDMGGDTEG